MKQKFTTKLHLQVLRQSYLFTARVSSTTGGYVFTGVCLLTWGDTPSRPRWVHPPANVGTPLAKVDAPPAKVGTPPPRPR